MPKSPPYFTTSAHSLHVGSGISSHAELQNRLCTFDLTWVGVELSRSRVYWRPPPAADQDRVHGLLLDADGGFVGTQGELFSSTIVSAVMRAI